MKNFKLISPFNYKYPQNFKIHVYSIVKSINFSKKKQTFAMKIKKKHLHSFNFKAKSDKKTIYKE